MKYSLSENRSSDLYTIGTWGPLPPSKPLTICSRFSGKKITQGANKSSVKRCFSSALQIGFPYFATRLYTFIFFTWLT